MQNSLYSQISSYLRDGDLPRFFASTRSNFKKMAAKFSLNEAGELTRGGLL